MRTKFEIDTGERKGTASRLTLFAETDGVHYNTIVDIHRSDGSRIEQNISIELDPDTVKILAEFFGTLSRFVLPDKP